MLNRIKIEGRFFVVVPEDEYKLLVAGAPPMPPRNADGTYPAVQAAEAMIARGLVRDREAVGLSQKELAKAAGIRVEVLNRAERGVTVPSTRTLMKIDKALQLAGLTQPRTKATTPKRRSGRG